MLVFKRDDCLGEFAGNSRKYYANIFLSLGRAV